MAEVQRKSRKRSGGKTTLPEDFQIYLDENLCNCEPILQVLRSSGIVFHRHLDHFAQGTADSVWLPFVGARRYVLVTTDKRFRYNNLERRAVQAYNIQCCEFSGNAAGAKKMAEALNLALPRIVRLRKQRSEYFVASISPSGHVDVRWDSKLPRKKAAR